MGLSIVVGILADILVNDPEFADELAPDFQTINDLLHQHGLPTYQEPTTLPDPDGQPGLDGFPYSFLHYLRRFYALRIDQPDKLPAPVAKGGSPSDDPIVDKISSPSHHLLWHSDCEGYYVPIDFPEVIESEKIAGGGFGSSVRLMEELLLIAAPLGITLHEGQLSDDDAATIANEEGAGGPYWIERLVWLTLFQAARLSVRHGAAIHFG